MFQELPHEYVSPDDLKEVVEKGGDFVLLNLCQQVVVQNIHS